MRPFKTLIAAAALACTPLIAAAPAHAQASGAVMVVDSQRIVTESTAGRDMNQRLQAIATQIQGELTPEQTALQQEQQALSQATQGQTEQQIRANAQLAARIETFNRRLETFSQRQQSLARDMEYTRAMALQEFNRQITPIVNEVMTQRNAQIVVDRRGVLNASAGVDATTDVISRFDQRVRTINVTRQTAPPPQQQPGH